MNQKTKQTIYKIIFIIVLTALTMLNYVLNAQNKLPKLKTDTLILDADINYFDRWDSLNNVLRNDTDPEKNPIKVKSWYLGATPYKINIYYEITGKGVIKVTDAGYVYWLPYNYWTGKLDFSYIAIDDKHTTGVRCYSQLNIVFKCYYRDNNGNCAHGEDHP